MAEPENMILSSLREMRATMDRRFDAVDKRFETMDQRFNAVDDRFDRVEKRLDNIRQAAMGKSVLGRYAAAEVEDRLTQIEKRLASLEVRKPTRRGSK